MIADEGGLSARFSDNEEPLALLAAAIERAGLEPQSDVAIALDLAASQFTIRNRIHLASENASIGVGEWLDRIARWIEKYPIVSVEDVVDEDDWSGWAEATQRLQRVQLLGDDLFVTNVARLQRGIEERIANAVLVKVNQAGTVSRAERTVAAAKTAGYATVVSARSGDTEDHWLADLAVGWRAGQIKVGSTMRSERTAKWNRLLEIESDGNTEFAAFPSSHRQ